MVPPRSGAGSALVVVVGCVVNVDVEFGTLDDACFGV
jgi:hypothetical protein